ncbi:MAG: FtsX-like permease family protein [Mobilicoccus sp.]|nr:FtsX-like permease family protein [Mobilicoccus sp.]
MNAVSLAPRLALSRMRARRGAVLDVLGVAAFTVSTWIALTVAGGTWMFVSRWQSLPAGADPDTVAWYAAYVVLALVACALLISPILGLGGAAARLGARGRSRRLASLRLLGMTGREVVSMSLVESLVQAVVGLVLGTGIYVLSLPLWRAVSLQDRPAGGGDMLTPWWLYLAVVAVLLALAAASTVLGLTRVRISPLGVATQQTPPALRWWRAAALVVAFVVFIVATQGFRVFDINVASYAVVAGLIAIVIGAVNLVGPFVLQLAAYAGIRTGSPSRLLAARRVLADPRGAWRNVAGVALLGVVAVMTSILPREATDPLFDGVPHEMVVLLRDLATGAFVTLGIALVVGAVMTLIAQSSDVVDRAEESIALDRMGMPRGTMLAARRHQVLGPLVVTLAVSLTAGVVLTVPFVAGGLGQSPVGIILLVGVLLVGLVLTLVAAEATRPIQAAILGEQRRRND